MTRRRWNIRVTACSERGATHERRSLPNQDAAAYWPSSGEGGEVVIAVADGHGSPKSFRSAIGAELAVRSATNAGREWLGRQPLASDAASVTALQRTVVDDWTASVADDLARRPLRKKELRSLAAALGESTSASVEANPRLAYGTTVLMAALSADRALFIQLGDGDILLVSESGVVSSPLPEDARYVGDETASLAMSDPFPDFRGAVVPTRRPSPLTLLATDGYSKSFETEDGFRRVGSDLAAAIAAEGFDAASKLLAEAVAEASIEGSGDDVTVAIAVAFPDDVRRRGGRT